MQWQARVLSRAARRLDGVWTRATRVDMMWPVGSAGHGAMRKDEAVRQLREHADAIRAIGARSLYLFGSRGLGEASETSDIDRNQLPPPFTRSLSQLESSLKVSS